MTALVLILISAACLALEDPTDDPVKDVVWKDVWTTTPGKPGCTFRKAPNYDSKAAYDDGSCGNDSGHNVNCGSCGATRTACRLYNYNYRL